MQPDIQLPSLVAFSEKATEMTLDLVLKIVYKLPQVYTIEPSQSNAFLLQENGDTLLHIATQNKDPDLAKLLVQWGAPPDEQNVRYQIFRNEKYCAQYHFGPLHSALKP